MERCCYSDSIGEEDWLLTYFTMRERETESDLEINIGHGFFMVKFDIQSDREKVMSGGPWMLFDHYVAVRPWEADFVSSEVTINKSMVWIRFPSLGMEYYDENVLTALSSTIGKPIRVDVRTIDASRGKFARICVEIDLEKSVVGKIWFRNRWIHVEYEGLHLICNKCGLFGHLGRNCLETNAPEDDEQNGDGVGQNEQGKHVQLIPSL